MKGRSIFYSLFVLVLMPLVAGSAAQQSSIRSYSGTGTKVFKNRAPLQSATLTPLPLTSIRPGGWLKRQLRIQADGLSGHLDEVWSDVGPNSAWLGGTGEAWERGPYFVDGLVPLAYLLDDAKLKAKAEKWVNWTLTHQGEDGSIGPMENQDSALRRSEADFLF